jgi:uncharacterized transporter YbjL
MAINVQKNMGFLALAIWLIINGLSGVITFSLPGPVMPVLALLAGILILAGR